MRTQNLTFGAEASLQSRVVVPKNEELVLWWNAVESSAQVAPECLSDLLGVTLVWCITDNQSCGSASCVDGDSHESAAKRSDVNNEGAKPRCES